MFISIRLFLKLTAYVIVSSYLNVNSANSIYTSMIYIWTMMKYSLRLQSELHRFIYTTFVIAFLLLAYLF